MLWSKVEKRSESGVREKCMERNKILPVFGIGRELCSFSGKEGERLYKAQNTIVNNFQNPE